MAGEIGPDGTWELPAGSGPCRTWPVQSHCSCLPTNPQEWDASQRHAVEVATELLWRLTAGRFGLCRELVRPCPAGCLPARPGEGFQPVIEGGQWINMSACGCRSRTSRRSCSCGIPPAEISLPGPVHWDGMFLSPEDTRYGMQVWVDGQQLDPALYWLREPNHLIRVDGQPWPSCQDLAAPAFGEGSFSVLYWRGTPVPPGGRRAVALLACELWKACSEDPGSCALPKRVETVQREGITYTMLDPLEFLSEGRVGLTEVDMWVAAVNPGKMHSPSAVYSPDLPRHRPDWHGGGAPPGLPPTSTGGLL